MAKLLACALNAEGGARVDFDPESPAAQAIMAGTSLDVVEMDAASNNSVDDIRELRENVALAPMQGGKRVYILDEAHMLTHGGVERVPEDARGAARARGVRARHDRGAQGAGHDRRPLPPLRLPAPVARADRRRAAAGGGRGGHRAARTRRSACSRARPPAVVPRRARHARAARDLRRQRGEARRRARDPRRGRRRAGARRGRGARRPRPARGAAHGAVAVRVGARLHPVHARPVRAPAPPVRGADARARARLVLGHRRAHRPARRPGRAHLPGRDPARDRLPRRRRSPPSRTAPSRASSSRWRC